MHLLVSSVRSGFQLKSRATVCFMRFVFVFLLLPYSASAVKQTRPGRIPNGVQHVNSPDQFSRSSSKISSRVAPFVSSLHAKARSAIRARRYHVASEIYKTILYQLPEWVDVPKEQLEDTYLLKALQDKREGEGMRVCSGSSKLLTALALLESKKGDLETAKKIVRAVSIMDPARGVPLVKWKQFREDPKELPPGIRRRIPVVFKDSKQNRQN
eukprot:CAMPEP_0167770352 /NCGR_PEP_ID=MMETSP0110_2-20121227/17880_1 /TAXON_ID=629695 /ORGANISM="Gymnochlora sp., Strain CCMP2014" /LENGTH=212 /DNA_ID=CAMNT_0007659537 /DNA_START=25 /DNA_END=663 /DNA_ORIENTATION=-